jgi:hypothetical protein
MSSNPYAWHPPPVLPSTRIEYGGEDALYASQRAGEGWHVTAATKLCSSFLTIQDTLAMNDAAYVILHWFDLHHVRWNFVKGWTITPNIRSTNARMDYVWLDLKELPHTR